MKKNIGQGIGFLSAVIIILMGLFLACVHYAHYANSLAPVIPFPDATYVGSEECAVCHEDVFDYFRKSVHFKIRSFEVAGQERGCESCHGPGSAHIRERGDVKKIVSFAALSPVESSAICLQCHLNEPLLHWGNSLHALSEVGCNDCHKSHKTTEKKMVYKGDPALCYDCHQQMRAKAEFPSHHPIREGKMRCTECHNPHGTETAGLREMSVNDLCYKCHTDKQGPFIYEHPPVEEDCSLCHDSHGTIANNLLKQNEPFLCLRCHRGHSGIMMAGIHPTTPALNSSCVQCHSQIHGSDLPSQMGRGVLTR